MKTFLEAHIEEKLRAELESICLRVGIASILLVLIYQIPTFQHLQHDRYNITVVSCLVLSLVFRMCLPKFTSLSSSEWRRLHLLTVISHSILWSLMLLNVSRVENAINEMYIITYLVFAGLVAAAAFSLAISKMDFYAFVVPVMASQTAAFFYNDYDILFKVASCLMVLLFFGYLSSQRERAEKNWLRLIINNFELQTIIDVVPGGISVLKSGKYSLVNKYVENLLPNSPPVIGSRLGDAFGKNQSFTYKMTDFINSKEKHIQFEADLYIDEKYRTHLVTAVKSFNDETIISTIDIHSIKEAEQQMLRQKAHLESSAKMAALGEMAGALAHEINNPLAIISGKAQHLLIQLSHDSASKENLVKGLENINKTGERIAKIIKGLQLFSSESENSTYEVINLKDVIEDTLPFCEAKFKNRGIELNYEIHADLLIECNSTQISQVLLNVLNNSHDAIINNDKKWISIKADADDDAVHIFITDSGDGISESIREKVMQPFFSTKAGKGSGLGLSISKGIVESHKGQLYFNHSYSKNTQLVISFPRFRKTASA